MTNFASCWLISPPSQTRGGSQGRRAGTPSRTIRPVPPPDARDVAPPLRGLGTAPHPLLPRDAPPLPLSPSLPRPFRFAPSVSPPPLRPRRLRCAANEKNCSMCVGFGAEPFEAGASESEKPRSRIWQLIGIRARFANTYAHRAIFRIPRCVKAEMGYAPHADWARN